MKLSRRQFFKHLATATAGAVALTSIPRLAFAAWNKEAFTVNTLEQAITAVYAGMPIEDSAAVKLKVPAIAENGAVVPVSVSTSLPNVKSISLFVEKNPSPLAASFNLSPQNIADISVRLRMGETSNLVALVESDGKLFRAQQEVKVTIGGCGG